MSEKFAGLTLGVDIEQVNRAVKSLRDFRKANDEAAKGVENFEESQATVARQTKQMSQSLKDQRQGFEDIRNAIDPTAKKMKELTALTKQLDNLWSKGKLSDSEFFELSGILDTQITKLNLSKKALTEEGRAALEESRAKERAATAGKNFLADLESQVAALGKTKSELLEMKAAQLGVSKQAAPFIAQLKNQEKQLKMTGISAGQYSQAMRMLPMQITDVVTSLASGMPVWMVAIQQGGQIKDSFGGIGNTFKVLLSLINPVAVGVGVVGAAFGALVYSVYSANKEFQEIKKTVSDTTGLTGDFADKVAMSVKSLAEVTDQTTDDVMKAYIKTGDSALDAEKKLIAVGMSYSEASAMVAKYKGTSNFSALNNAIAEHQLKVADLKKSWMDVAVEKAKAFSLTTLAFTSGAIGDINARKEQAKQFSVINQAKKLQEDLNEAIKKGNQHVADTVALINQEYLAADRVAGAEKALAEARKNANAIAASGNKEAIANAKKLIKIREDELQQAKDAEKKKGSKKDGKSGGIVRAPTEQLDKELYTLQAQLETLKKHRDINDRISAQRKSLWVTEGQIKVLEDAQSKRKLTEAEKTLLLEQKQVLAKAQQKAELGDQIVKQQQMNQLQQDSLKFIMQMNQATATLNATRGMGAMAAQREAERQKMQSDWLAKGGSVDDAAFVKMQEAQDKYYAEEDAKRADWLSGAKSAFETYGEEATNMYANVGSIATNALSGMSDMMAQFLMTGQANFADFAKSIISDIIKMITKMVIFNTLASAFGGGGTWTMGSLMSGFATGGYTGDGAKYEPAGVVHKGEFVMTKEATKRIGVDNLYRMMRGYANGGYVGGGSQSGGGMVMSGSAPSFNIGNIDVNVNNGSDPKGLTNGVKAIVSEELNKCFSQGGRGYEFVLERTNK